MSHPHYPFDRNFHPSMSKCLVRLASNFEIDNRIVQWDEFISSDTILNELTHALSRCGWHAMTFEEIRKELLRLHVRWKKQQHKSATFLRTAREHTYLWTEESEDKDDIFMPSSKAKTPASSNGKSESLSKGKSASSSKGKSSSSSKGKSAASTEDDDDVFM